MFQVKSEDIVTPRSLKLSTMLISVPAEVKLSKHKKGKSIVNARNDQACNNTLPQGFSTGKSGTIKSNPSGLGVGKYLKLFCPEARGK